MSKLKARKFFEAVPLSKEGFYQPGAFVNAYLKSEADKVIAELEESHKKEVEQLLILNREQANAANRLRDSMEQTIRHQKYKRCLAMAMWCEAEVHRSLVEQSALIDFPEIDRFQYLQWRFVHFKRWHNRWLELAEKFKEEG